jgi:hypothetical protein
MGLFFHSKELKNLYHEMLGRIYLYEVFGFHPQKSEPKFDNPINLEELFKGILLFVFGCYSISIFVFVCEVKVKLNFALNLRQFSTEIFLKTYLISLYKKFPVIY